MMTKEIETLKEAGLPVSMEDMAKDAAMGGKMEMRDIAAPFLYILQTNSPQTNGDHPKYIKGAVAGMCYLTVVEKVFEGREIGVTIVPCFYQRNITEWKPREKGGGVVKVHDAHSDIVNKGVPNEKGVPVLPNGNLLVETALHYVLVKGQPDDATWYQAIMPLKSTGLKISRRLNSSISMLRIPGSDRPAPRFLYSWNLKSVKEQKDDQIWSSPAFSVGQIVDKNTYLAAKAYSEIAASGILQTVEPEEDVAPKTSMKDLHDLNDDIPF